VVADAAGRNELRELELDVNASAVFRGADGRSCFPDTTAAFAGRQQPPEARAGSGGARLTDARRSSSLR